MQRVYIKSSDWYDLYWYLRQPQWAAPNLAMLNQALTQSGWTKGIVTATNWQQFVQERLDTLDWQRVVADVQPFVMNQQELADFKQETVQQLLNLTAPW